LYVSRRLKSRLAGRHGHSSVLAPSIAGSFRRLSAGEGQQFRPARTARKNEQILLVTRTLVWRYAVAVDPKQEG
jgi:hypothetical protein